MRHERVDVIAVIQAVAVHVVYRDMIDVRIRAEHHVHKNPDVNPVDITVEWNGVLSLPERFSLSRTQRVSQKDVTIRTDR